MHMDRLQDPLRLQKPSRYSVMIKWRPSHSFNPCSPSTCLPTIMSCTPNNHSFYLLLRLLGANTSPCTHPNPSPPSSVPPYPLCLRSSIVFFGGYFPSIHVRETCPANPCMSLFVLFACVLVSMHPKAPIQTHAPISKHNYSYVYSLYGKYINYDFSVLI